MSAKNLRPDLQAQLPVIRLMLASSCVGRDVCPTPPCACAQSLIDSITTAKIEKLRAALTGIAEYCSGDGHPLGAIERLIAVRNTALRALEQKVDKS